MVGVRDGGRGVASKNLQQRSLILQYNFAQKTSLNEPHLTHHSIMRKIYSYNTAKIFTHFTNFPASSYISQYVSGVRKSICTALFLKAKELHFQSTWKASVSIFEYYRSL